MTDDSRTTRRQTCRDCAALTSGDCGQHEPRIAMLRTWIAEDLTLRRTVTIDAELLDETSLLLGIALANEIARAGVQARDSNEDEWIVATQRALARVRAAREG